ncbi:MAG: uracil-DNA glycosylase [Patescibacteria group bacterium]
MTETTKTDQLREVRDAVVNLTTSPLYAYRKANNYFSVLGEGSHDAKVMFIGEAPGKNEAEKGRPFCGAAGKVLDKLLTSINLKREDVYVTNIVKDRPPENRDPLPEEIEAYGPFLDRQIEIIQPKVLATLGRFSMAYILNRFNLSALLEPIGKAHGKIYTATTSYGEVTIIPVYHPATALYNNSMFPALEADFKVIEQVLAS